MKNQLTKLFSHLPIMYLRYVNVAIAIGIKRKILKAFGYTLLEDFVNKLKEDELSGVPMNLWHQYLDTKIGRKSYVNSKGQLCGCPKFDRKKAISVFQSHYKHLRLL